jgi:C4-dicarboxylate transporter DctM subunit
MADDVNLLIVVQRMFASTDSFPLIAVPFFIFSGDLLARGAISKRLMEFAEAALGRIRGGLSVVTVGTAMFFSAISGSGAATTAAVGSTVIPELKARGYREESSAALVAASGTIGVVLPPSVPMVLYAVIADQSVIQLFRNGFLPGILMGGTLIAIAVAQAYKYNYPQGAKFSLKNLWKTFTRAIWGILMPVIILGGIFSGYFTPSEAAVIAVVYAAFASMVIYRDLTFKEIYQIMAGSARTTAIIMIIIACSGSFGWVLANLKIPQQIASGVLSISSNKYVIMFLIAAIIMALGLFMETSSAIIILSPVFLPLVIGLGVDLVHFGIIIVVGVAIGMITPPVAINLFVASSISGIPIEKIIKAEVPYLLGLLTVFLLVVYVPMFLPWVIF